MYIRSMTSILWIPNTRNAVRTGLSTATITRVNRALRYGSDGYHMVLDRLMT